jgi:hypothetical protein
MVLTCVAGLIAVGIAFAEDFWATKEYMQWTDEEVKKVLTNSPWAKDVTINAPLAALGRGQRPSSQSAAGTDIETAGAGGGGGRGGRRGGGRGGSGFGDESGGGSEALLTLNISWRSALPLKKALVRSRLGVGAPVPAEARQLITAEEQDYVIVVSGVPRGMSRLFENSGIAGSATIRAGKKPSLAAKSVNLQPRTQSVDVVYLFPRTQPIESGDKEVEVVIKFGAIEAKKKFTLKDMVYNGKLEL